MLEVWEYRLSLLFWSFSSYLTLIVSVTFIMWTYVCIIAHLCKLSFCVILSFDKIDNEYKNNHIVLLVHNNLNYIIKYMLRNYLIVYYRDFFHYYTCVHLYVCHLHHYNRSCEHRCCTLEAIRPQYKHDQLACTY